MGYSPTIPPKPSQTTSSTTEAEAGELTTTRRASRAEEKYTPPEIPNTPISNRDVKIAPPVRKTPKQGKPKKIG